MRTFTDTSTQFFSVVGVPYIAEHHFESFSEDNETPGFKRPVDLTALPRPCTTGSWLQDEG